MKYFLATAGVIVFIFGLVWFQTKTDTPNIPKITSTIPKVVPATTPLSNKATLLFGGDVMLSRGIGNLMLKNNDFTYPFQAIAPTLKNADLRIVNLESPISSVGKNIGSIYSFRANPRSVEGLSFAGIDVVSLANNHSGDYGPLALSETLELLSKARIGVAGAGIDETRAHTPLFYEINGLKIAFLGYTPLAPLWLTETGASPAVADLNETRAKEDISTARNQGADIVVVMIHSGEEYDTKQSSYQEIFARNLIDAGATIIIGHHPHVVQDVERYNGGVVAYSLGNFVFDQNFSEDTRNGLLLKVTVSKKEVLDIEKIPIRFSDTFQPYAGLKN
ncbi:MAG: CapA family protein [Candidatus Pacebacteria bacterium]|nr:CapA family protein [Candidatus Paceibacterota bacterium]